jgi:hypothetical protein
MGAIQGAINSMIGSVATAAEAIKQTKDVDAIKAITAENQASVAEGEAMRATHASNEEINKWQTEKVDTGERDAKGKPIMDTMSNMHTAADVRLSQANSELGAATKSGDAVRLAKAMTEREAAQKAFRSLNDEYTAMIDRADRAAAMRANAVAASSRAEELRGKYDSKWTLGGKR